MPPPAAPGIADGQHRRQIAYVDSAWSLLQWDGTGEIGIVAAQSRRWKHGDFASIQSFHLLVRHANGGGRCNVLWIHATQLKHGVDGGLVQTSHRAQRASNQV